LPSPKGERLAGEPGIASEARLDCLEQVLQAERDVHDRTGDEESGSSAHSALAAALDVLVDALPVDLVPELVVEALQIEPSRAPAPENTLSTTLPKSMTRVIRTISKVPNMPKPDRAP
jgi:hypothetical protein